jgi:ribosomal protein L15E
MNSMNLKRQVQIAMTHQQRKKSQLNNMGSRRVENDTQAKYLKISFWS